MLTLVCEEIYLKRNVGVRHATAKCRSVGTRHAKGLQELAPSSALLAIIQELYTSICTLYILYTVYIVHLIKSYNIFRQEMDH